MTQRVMELLQERGIGPRLAERRLELFACCDERLGYEATAEVAHLKPAVAELEAALIDYLGAKS